MFFRTVPSVICRHLLALKEQSLQSPDLNDAHVSGAALQHQLRKCFTLGGSHRISLPTLLNTPPPPDTAEATSDCNLWTVVVGQKKSSYGDQTLQPRSAPTARFCSDPPPAPARLIVGLVDSPRSPTPTSQRCGCSVCFLRLCVSPVFALRAVWKRGI